jgi:hypothetical protein
MTTSPKRFGKRIVAVTLALLAASQLAGCGGDDDPPRTSTPPGDVGNGGNGGNNGGGNNNGGGGNGGNDDIPPAGAVSGVFVDAPVAGLSYLTSSDISGVTDAHGRYNYLPGDTVTFSVGDLVLGTVVAQGVVTPMTVAAALVENTSTSAETVAVNLLMLLQSLDSNGNPADGISFTAEIRAAVAANSIDLTADEAAFTSALNTFVSSVSSTSGVTLTAVSRSDAIEHFTGQVPNTLAGVYVRADENFEPITQNIVTLAMFRNGRYLLGGQHDDAACDFDSSGTPATALAFSDARGNGVEYGSYTWDPLSNTFAVSDLRMETDGFCGFNKPVLDATNDITQLEITANGLVFSDAEGNVAYRFARLDSSGSTLGGSWVQPVSLMNGYPFMFTLFPSSEDGKSGRYLMVDASLPDEEYDTSPGIEQGCYSVDADDHLSIELNASLCENAIDTNDTAGLSDPDAAEQLQMLVDENDRLLIVEDEAVTSFARYPGDQLTHSALAGAWILENAPGAELGMQEKLVMLTVFEDGRFLFATHENDASCVASYPMPGQEEGGNGLEYGTLSLTDGVVLPEISVDTNGECGLFNIDNDFLQRYYYIVPTAAGDALAVWPNDEEDAAGLVFKRVPSVPNEITGAWLWTDENGSIDEFAVVAFLPSGVMFEAALFGDESGLRRESFTMNGNVMTSHIRGYEFCLDTQSEQSECVWGDEYLTETYTVQGDIIIDDDAEGTITRIPAP